MNARAQREQVYVSDPEEKYESGKHGKEEMRDCNANAMRWTARESDG